MEVLPLKNASKPPIVKLIPSYMMSRKNIVFIKTAHKIGNFMCITPWYDFERKKFVHPTINLIYLVLLVAILALLFSSNIQGREFLDEQMVQKFLITLSDIISVILMEYLVVSGSVLRKEKWKLLLDMFASVDGKLENDHGEKSKLIENFYVQFFLGHVLFIGCYSYKTFVWSFIIGFKYFSNFGTMVIPMYYCFFSAMLLSNIVLALRCRYKDVNALLNEKVRLHRDDEDELLKDLQIIRNLFEHVGDIVEVFNDTFGWVVILTILHAIIEILNCVNLILRSFADPAFSWGIFSSCLWVCSLSMGGALFIVLCCDSASTAGTKIVRLCYKLEENFDRRSDCRLELSNMAQFARITRPKFLAANFFVIDRSTVLGILSIATTYLIVVIQFNSAYFNMKN